MGVIGWWVLELVFDVCWYCYLVVFVFFED